MKIKALGTDNFGSRGGPRQVVLSLFCRNAPVVPTVTGTLNTANPSTRPPWISMRTVISRCAAPGPWFAGGVIAPKWNKGRWKYWD